MKTFTIEQVKLIDKLAHSVSFYTEKYNEDPQDSIREKLYDLAIKDFKDFVGISYVDYLLLDVA